MSDLPKRSEVPVAETWDLSLLFSSEEAYEKELADIDASITSFVQKYKDHIHTAEDAVAALLPWEEIQARLFRLSSYTELDLEVDYTSTKASERFGAFSIKMDRWSTTLNFFENALASLSASELERCQNLDPIRKLYWQNLAEDRKHRLSDETEDVLAALSSTLSLPYATYNTAKLADLRFKPFEAGKRYENDFVTFENNYQYEEDTAVRRAAFASFSEDLSSMANTFATLYNAQVQKEKVLSKLKGFDSVLDYLLAKQKIEPALYHRQIDVIMRDLPAIMRRYIRLLAKVHAWDKVTYADLKVPLDPSFTPEITQEEACGMAEEALKVMGEEYSAIIHEGVTQRWIDFARNEGKATGGFCASPYGSNSFILMSWNGLLSEVFTLVHELGHAAHFTLAQKNQPISNYDPSLYMVEAPSTCNEMLLSNYLLSKDDQGPRFKRWVLASMISNTYYHNFVTHLLEADFQRKVYRLVDQGESLNAAKLCALKKETLAQFWGDEVELVPGCEYTWMRQPHYYMGLYPYTYSAGLTLGTVVSQRIRKEGKPAVEDWLNMLKAGASLSAVDLAQVAGVDISTEKPLQDTLAFIEAAVLEMETLTECIAQEA